ARRSLGLLRDLFEELDGGVRDRELAALLDPRLEDDARLALAPHLGHEGLAREHRVREPHLDALEEPRVAARRELRDDVPGREAERAEPVENGPLEAEALRERGVGVQRIPVAREAVE